MGNGLYRPLCFYGKTVLILMREVGDTERPVAVPALHFTSCFVVDIIYLKELRQDRTVFWCLTTDSYKPDLQPWFLIRAVANGTRQDEIAEFIVNDEFGFYPLIRARDLRRDSVNGLVVAKEDSIVQFWCDLSELDRMLVEAAIASFMSGIL